MGKTSQTVWYAAVFLEIMMFKIFLTVRICLRDKIKAQINLIIFSRVYKETANNHLAINHFNTAMYSSRPLLLMLSKIANKS
jgi:hypothetical protein